MSIEIKSLGVLIDELVTCDLKCWFQQEIICQSTDHAKVAEAAQKAQALNARRNALIQAIDRKAGEKFTTTDKTY